MLVDYLGRFRPYLLKVLFVCVVMILLGWGPSKILAAYQTGIYAPPGRPTATASATPINGDIPVPLTDLGSGSYQGFMGGLYPGGQNQPPSQHTAEGLARAMAIQPLDVNGNPDPAGRIIFLSIGMSNTSSEFCGGGTTMSHCDPGTFGTKLFNDPQVNHDTLTVVNGAKAGQVVQQWLGTAGDENYQRVATILSEMGQPIIKCKWLG